MKQPRTYITFLGLIIGVGLIIGFVWGNYQFAKKNIAGGGFSIQWLAIRSLVSGGVSPYSEQVADQIRESVKFQVTFAAGNLPRYISPLFSGIVVLPFALIEDYSLAHALWLAVQLIALFLIILLGLRLTTWEPPWYVFLVFSLVTAFSYHAFIPWLDGSLAIWAALFMILVFFSIRNNWNEMGGVFLALAAIQPQMTILAIIFILFWAASQKKRILIVWFFMTLILLSVLGLFLVPDWLMQYLKLIYNFKEYFPPGNPGTLFVDLWPGLGKLLGWLVMVAFGILVIFESWLAHRKDFRQFLWTACLIMVISQWIGIPTIPGNFIGLILPLILVLAMLSERWRWGGPWMAVVISVVGFIWEWVLFYNNIFSANPHDQLNLIIPMPFMLIIGLYWVRWWVVKPKRRLFEELRFVDH